MVAIRRDQGRLAELVPEIERTVARYHHQHAWATVLPLVYLEAGDRERALAAYQRFAGDRLGDLPRNLYWLGGLALLTEACVGLPGAPGAAPLYAQLLPFATRVVQVSCATCLGSVERYLGMLAGAIGRGEAARRHYESALEVNAALGAKTMLARTECDYAAMLLAAGTGDDRARAEELVASSAQAARELTMAPLVERASALVA
jgi:tetratricopeptide (TPR) repeat protein